MPNGVSCACFALRNHKIAENTNNVFRRGIADIQTVRTLDAIAQTDVIQKTALKPATTHLNNAANFLRKLVYPLIIGSAIYTTSKSDDKVKTGLSQAAGIGAMYGMEKLAELGLENIEKKVNSLKGGKYTKLAKMGWYVARGLIYLSVSLSGYKSASEFVSSIIDKIRGKKGSEVINPTDDMKEKSKAFKNMV